MCVNHPKTLTSQEQRSTLGVFGLKIFHGFCIFSGKMKPNACFMFFLVMKMRENLYNKSYRTRQPSVKTLKKHQNEHT